MTTSSAPENQEQNVRYVVQLNTLFGILITQTEILTQPAILQRKTMQQKHKNRQD